MQKRYIIVIIVLIVVCLLVWKLSSSYAIYNPGYQGNNLVTGDKWGVNIIEVGDFDITGKAVVNQKVSTIGTTLNFAVSLFEPGDKITFDFVVKNTGKLKAELYKTTLSGLSEMASEVITYQILPVDYLNIHSDTQDGSIIKTNEEQTFHVTIKYEDNIANNNHKEYNLSLGSTIIYKQR